MTQPYEKLLNRGIGCGDALRACQFTHFISRRLSSLVPFWIRELLEALATATTCYIAALLLQLTFFR